MSEPSKRPTFSQAGTTVALVLAKQEALEEQQGDGDNPPSEILQDFLFLGDCENASRLSQLRHFGITHVLNITQSRDIGTDEGVERLFLYANDTETEPIAVLFPPACAFIEKARQVDGRILIHCMAGRSRSATLVIAYLMRHHRMQLLDAFGLVKQRRPIAMPNIGFWEQLVAEEVRLFGVPSGTPACYEQLLELRRQDQETTAASLFHKFSTAFAIPDAAAREVAEESVLQQWPAGWSGAQAVEDILMESLEHLNPKSRLAAVRFVKQLLLQGKVAQAEAAEGLDRVAAADMSDMRLDVPKVDDYIAEILDEAANLKLVCASTVDRLSRRKPAA